MPIYEYRCRSCGDTSEELRAVADADAPATCVNGHDDTVRLLSLVARAAPSGGAAAGGPPPSSGGGCCGGGCCA